MIKTGKLWRILISLLITCIPQSYLYSQCTGTLVWSDEFDEASLDLTKWSYQTGNGCPSLCGWGNGELEYYTNTTNNVYLGGGILTIEAKTESNIGGCCSFSSGKILSQGLASFTYGRFEASLRLPQGAGLWPAFWLLPEVANWPTTGEIDIMEYRGDITNREYGTLHYGNLWPNDQYDGSTYDLPSGNFYSAYHVFAVEWDQNEIRWYVDNTLFKSVTRSPNSLNPQSNNANTWPWNANFYIILNLAVGGSFTGVTTTSGVQLTKPTFEIDYVRVYDISGTTPYTGTALTIPGTIEAENYDVGCGVASYSDTDAGNTGGAYRIDNVDIETTSDVSGSYDVGWIQTGEYLLYTVNVQSSTNYNFLARAASSGGSGQLHAEIDGTNITGTVNISNTGGWQNWQDFSVSSIPLTAGTHTLKIYFDNAGLNLNYVKFSSSTLPVNLINFTATKTEHGIEILWQTQSEKDNSHFIIKKSKDGITWATLDNIPGSNTNNISSYYAYDPNPYENVNYYSLYQVDNEGTEELLSTTSVTNHSEIKIYSQNENIIIDCYEGFNDKEIYVINELGEQLKLKKAIKDITATLTIPESSSRILLVKIVSSDRVVTKKVFLY